MKKHGVMLFTFVILFLTLGCDWAYGQEKEGNEKEEVMVALNFTGLNYGLEINDPWNPPILNKCVTVQNVKVNLSGYIHVNSNNIRLSNYSGDNSGTIDISVPKNDTIKSIIITTKTAKKMQSQSLRYHTCITNKKFQKNMIMRNPKSLSKLMGLTVTTSS